MRHPRHEVSQEFVNNLHQHGATEQHMDALRQPNIVYLENGNNTGIEYSLFEGQEDSSKPTEVKETIFYVPGFSENPISNAPLAVTLAQAGFDVVLPGYYDGPIIKNAAGKQDALLTRATYYHAILDKISGRTGTVHFVTHSMGSLVVQKMAESGDPVFEGAQVAMLAPSGISSKESMLKMTLRNVRNMKTEKSRGPQQFNDEARDMEQSCFKYMRASMRRTIREVWELSRKSGFNPEPFKQAGVARIALIGYANDALYPDSHIQEAFHQLVAAGIDTTYVTPIKVGLSHDTATHNDEQSNPARVAPLLGTLLRQS